MDEEKVKKLLRIEFLKELPDEMVKNGKLRNKEYLEVNEKGEVSVNSIIWSRTIDVQKALTDIINYLANELATVKVDQWLKSLSTKQEHPQ